MAFSIHWTIPFVSLRTKKLYTVNIYSESYSGDPVVLKGGAQPFVTDEDINEDMFTPIRTQSGYIRIVDDGKDAADTPLANNWWRSFIPSTDSDRPVTLTVTDEGVTTVVWHGFMQSQNFSGTLYGNPQEREFPVIGATSVIAGEDIQFNRGLKNFAFLLKDVCDTIDVMSGGSRTPQDILLSNGVIHIDTIMVQGGVDARQWLQTKIDWQNFATEDGEGVLIAKYSLYEVLEEMCRFWGWTCRIHGTTLYLTCADDYDEYAFLVLSRSDLDTLAFATQIDTSTGSVVSPNLVTLQDTAEHPIFASTNNEDYKIQGPHRAVVTADCNKQDTIVEFAPKEVEDWIEQGSSYSWVQGGDDLVGYFTCPGGAYEETGKQGTNLGTLTLKVSTSLYGGLSRRQIYQSTDSDSPLLADMLMSLANRPNYNESIIQLQTLRPMSFGGGSISLGGTLWRGAEQIQHEQNLYVIRMRLGIGMTRETAKWWNMKKDISYPNETITSGWSTTMTDFNVPLVGNTLKSTGVSLNVSAILDIHLVYGYPAIPIPTNQNLYGYVFIDILYGYDYSNGNQFDDFQIANFSIEYSRDTYEIPTSLNVIRPRELVTKRVTSKEYSAVNTNDSKEEWKASCIFASDNNMEYGYGLLLDGNGNIKPTVNYGGSSEHPEQHLADRVANYWAVAKRKINAELLANIVPDITPENKVKMTTDPSDHTVFAPISISRDWRDDIVKLSLLQI